MNLAIDVLTDSLQLYKTTEIANEHELVALVMAWQENVEKNGFSLRIRKAR